MDLLKKGLNINANVALKCLIVLFPLRLIGQMSMLLVFAVKNADRLVYSMQTDGVVNHSGIFKICFTISLVIWKA